MKRSRHGRYDDNGRAKFAGQLNYDEESARGQNNLEKSGSESEEEHEYVEQYTQGPLDLETGQRSAFPLQSLEGVDANDQDVQEVIGYLAAIRKQTSQLPRFVRVKTKDRDDAGKEAEGTTIHKLETESTTQQPTLSRTDSGSTTDHVNIPRQWYEEFMAEFLNFRRQIQAASENTELPSIRWPSTMAKWRVSILDPSNSPTPESMAALPYSQTLRVISYSEKWLTRDVQPELKIWVYALLARLADSVTGEEIGMLRHVLKKCIVIYGTGGTSADTTTSTNRNDAASTEGDTVTSPAIAAIPATDSCASTSGTASALTPTTIETINMIAAVVGGLYRQGDLVNIID